MVRCRRSDRLHRSTQRRCLNCRRLKRCRASGRPRNFQQSGSIMSDKAIVAVLGGSGAEGSGLALRIAHAGYQVVIGSRDANRAIEAAREIAEHAKGAKVSGTDNLSAARQAELVILTVPWSAQRSTLENVKDALAGKILVDVTVPLVPPKVNRVQLPAEHSAAVGAQMLLGEQVRVV